MDHIKRLRNRLSNFPKYPDPMSIRAVLDYPLYVFGMLCLVIMFGSTRFALVMLAFYILTLLIASELSSAANEEQNNFNDAVIENVKLSAEITKANTDRFIRAEARSKAAITILGELFKKYDIVVPGGQTLDSYIESLIDSVSEEVKDITNYNVWLKDVSTLDDLEKDLKNE